MIYLIFLAAPHVCGGAGLELLVPHCCGGVSPGFPGWQVSRVVCVCPALPAVCAVAVPAALLRAEERGEDGQRRSLLQVSLLNGFCPKYCPEKLVLKVLVVVKLGCAVGEIKSL